MVRVKDRVRVRERSLCCSLTLKRNILIDRDKPGRSGGPRHGSSRIAVPVALVAKSRGSPGVSDIGLASHRVRVRVRVRG